MVKKKYVNIIFYIFLSKEALWGVFTGGAVGWGNAACGDITSALLTTDSVSNGQHFDSSCTSINFSNGAYENTALGLQVHQEIKALFLGKKTNIRK